MSRPPRAGSCARSPLALTQPAFPDIRSQTLSSLETRPVSQVTSQADPQALCPLGAGGAQEMAGAMEQERSQAPSSSPLRTPRVPWFMGDPGATPAATPELTQVLSTDPTVTVPLESRVQGNAVTSSLQTQELLQGRAEGSLWVTYKLK